MNYTLKKNMFSLIQGTGLFAFASRFNTSKGFILMFHRVRKKNEPSVDTSFFHNLGLSITSDYLLTLIDRIQADKKYRFLSLNDISRTEPTQEKFIILTFDDGYIDNYSIVYPILKQRNIPFTLYISNIFPDKHAILWWYLLSELITTRSRVTFTFHKKSYAYDTSTQGKKTSAYAIMEQMIKASIPHHQEELFHSLFIQNGLDPDAYARSETMSWDNIRTLSRDSLVTIGAHTMNHYPLANLGKKELRLEISKAKQELEEKTGRSIEHFSFPYGKHADISPAAMSQVTRAGFRTAVTTCEANIYATDRDSLLRLPRFTISGKFEHPGFLDLCGSGLYAPLLRLERKFTAI